MALIDCPDCASQVSSAAVSCPKCGYPIAKEVQRAVRDPEAETSEEWKTLGETAHDPKPMKKPMRGVPYSDQEVAVLLSQKSRTSHLLHFFLSLFTLGIWIPIWIFVGIVNGIANASIDSKIAKGKEVY